MKTPLRGGGVSLMMLTAWVAAQPPPQTRAASVTRVVLLGTGNPGIDPDRSGPATAVVVNDTPYLVDFGPGVVRRAKAAVLGRGIKALEPTNLRVAFVTHLHSDHTVGYPDLIFTPWTVGRRVPLEVYGPDRSIVISGDTNPTQATIDACRGCDVLIHEVLTPAHLATRPDTFQRFAAKYHTTTIQLADLAREARPRLLILYHYSSVSPEELLDDMLARYSGHFVIGRDLDVY